MTHRPNIATIATVAKLATKLASASRHTRLFTLLSISAAIGLASPLAASAATVPAPTTPGSLDTSFGSGGFSVVGYGTQAYANASVVLSNGNIVAVGTATVGGQQEMVAMQTRPNGQLDTTFGNGGWAAVAGIKTANGNAIAVQSNGDLVLAGTANDPVVGSLSLAAARLLPNGQIDTSFGHNGLATVPVGYSAMANAVAILPNGQIVLGGTANVSGHNSFVATRLNADGSLDTSFGTNGTTALSQAGAAWGMVLQPDGSVVLAGQESYHLTQAYMAARLLPNGQLDPSFGQGGVVTIPIGLSAIGLAIALQPNGEILVTGDGRDGVGHADVATVRLNPDGSLDPSFGTGGISQFPGYGVNAIALQANGQILLAGVGATVVRLNADGTGDTSFGRNDLAYAQYPNATTAANGVTVQSNGEIVLSGVATVAKTMKFALVRMWS